MLTPKYKLEYMCQMNKAGKLEHFLQSKQNYILHYGLVGRTYLKALYNELSKVTEMSEDEVTVFEMLKVAQVAENI